MVDIKAGREMISLGTIDTDRLDEIVELYNSSEYYRYATGMAYPVNRDDILLKLDRLQTSKNEFFSGIYSSDAADGSSELYGVISGALHENTLWLKLLAIQPQFRNRGIGRIAAGLIFDYMKNVFSVTDVLLSVIGKNENGIRFWRKQGFAESGRFKKNLFGDPELYEVIIMNKKL